MSLFQIELGENRSYHHIKSVDRTSSKGKVQSVIATSYKFKSFDASSLNFYSEKSHCNTNINHKQTNCFTSHSPIRQNHSKENSEKEKFSRVLQDKNICHLTTRTPLQNPEENKNSNQRRTIVKRPRSLILDAVETQLSNHSDSLLNNNSNFNSFHLFPTSNSRRLDNQDLDGPLIKQHNRSLSLSETNLRNFSNESTIKQKQKYLKNKERIERYRKLLRNKMKTNLTTSEKYAGMETY